MGISKNVFIERELPQQQKFAFNEILFFWGFPSPSLILFESFLMQ